MKLTGLRGKCRPCLEFCGRVRLRRVRALFLESPFLSRDDSVSIMDGTDEGWWRRSRQNPAVFTVLARPQWGCWTWWGVDSDHLHPQDEKTIQTSPIDYIRSFQMFNNTHTVYTHSYLGLGLMSARLAILGGVNASPQYSGSWKHGDIIYTVKGQKAAGVRGCRTKVEKLLYRKVTKAAEAADVDFYAFSYYYDARRRPWPHPDVTGHVTGCWAVIGRAALTRCVSCVCSVLSVSPLQSPFLCLDLVYISVLLQELGFPPHKQFKILNVVGTSWILSDLMILNSPWISVKPLPPGRGHDLMEPLHTTNTPHVHVSCLI
ncbi:hypothetical protein INR49_007347 [Caranx melampygus]|nr:hypothetical protein INR49_007347 [Caranx melampygus]